MVLMTLLSFKTLINSSKEIAFQAVQVQSVLREDLYWIYIKNPTLENESNYVDAKYVEDLLLKIVKDNNSSNTKAISEAARVQSVLKEELYWLYVNSGTVVEERRYIDARYVESLILEIINDKTSNNN